MLLPGAGGEGERMRFSLQRIQMDVSRVGFFFSPLSGMDVTCREGRRGMLTQHPLPCRLVRCGAVAEALHFPCPQDGFGVGEGFAAWCGAVLNLLCPPGTDPRPG